MIHRQNQDFSSAIKPEQSPEQLTGIRKTAYFALVKIIWLKEEIKCKKSPAGTKPILKTAAALLFPLRYLAETLA